jgi:hypothetical protein
VVNGVLLTGHKGPAVEVPFHPAERRGAPQVPRWPGRRGYSVHVFLDRARFESIIVSRMRRFFVLVHKSIVQQVGLAWATASVSPFGWPGHPACLGHSSRQAYSHGELAGRPSGTPEEGRGSEEVRRAPNSALNVTSALGRAWTRSRANAGFGVHRERGARQAIPWLFG